MTEAIQQGQRRADMWVERRLRMREDPAPSVVVTLAGGVTRRYSAAVAAYNSDVLEIADSETHERVVAELHPGEWIDAITFDTDGTWIAHWVAGQA